MTTEQAQQLIGFRVGVRHGKTFFEGILTHVHKTKAPSGRATKPRTHVEVRLRRFDGMEDTAIFNLDQLVDLDTEFRR